MAPLKRYKFHAVWLAGPNGDETYHTTQVIETSKGRATDEARRRFSLMFGRGDGLVPVDWVRFDGEVGL